MLPTSLQGRAAGDSGLTKVNPKCLQGFVDEVSIAFKEGALDISFHSHRTTFDLVLLPGQKSLIHLSSGKSLDSELDLHLSLCDPADDARLILVNCKVKGELVSCGNDPAESIREGMIIVVSEGRVYHVTLGFLDVFLLGGVFGPAISPAYLLRSCRCS